MATGARSYKPLDGVLGNGICLVGGYFEINGTSAPTVLSGVGWSVAYTSAGTWTITLEQKYTALVGSGIAFHNAVSNADLVVQWKGTLTTNNTMIVQIMTATTPTTPATATGTGVSFILMLRRSRVAN